jgi:hypothetical protein
VAADLTRWGYGAAPLHTMPWRQFWHAWVHHYLRDWREKQETQSFQLYVATLQGNPKGAEQVRERLELAQGQAERRVLLALDSLVPNSVRALLGARDLAASVRASSDPLAWWLSLMAKYPEGSPKWKFYRGGLIAAQERQQEREPRPN